MTSEGATDRRDGGPATDRWQDLGFPSPDDLVAALVDGLTVHDATGRYLFVSGCFEELTGFEAEQLVGESPFTLELFHPQDLDTIVEVQSRALESQQPWKLTYRLRRADDAYVWVTSTGQVVGTAAGDRFVVATGRADHIESLLKGVEQERELKRRLQEVVAQQRRFLTTVSHRARTPLTAVLGSAQILRSHGDELVQDRRDLLMDRLVANAEKLTELLTEVTDADQLSRADVVLHRRVVELRPLALEVVDRVAASREVVGIEIPEQLRAVVDADKVTRILELLVGNAFTHGGVGVSVRISASAEAEGVTLAVDDDGPGVPDAEKRGIFAPFERGDPDDADPGAGLGLYLVSELAALHGGRVWVEDGPDGGACFRVFLPLPENWGNDQPSL